MLAAAAVWHQQVSINSRQATAYPVIDRWDKRTDGHLPGTQTLPLEAASVNNLLNVD